MRMSRTHSTKGDKKLQIKVGSSESDLEIIIPNDYLNPRRVRNESFSGNVVFRVKDYDPDIPDESGYFKDHKRVFSLQIHGEFLNELRGNNLVWYCQFDKPINVPGIFIAFFNMIAPQAHHDLGGTQPFIQSFALTTSSVIKSWGNKVEEFPNSIQEDVTNLLPPHLHIKKPWTLLMSHDDAMVHARRKFFSHEENRESAVFKVNQTVSNKY